MCVHICRRVCTLVSRGTCLCLHTCVSGYLCPPVSKPPVFLCVLVCTWISMCVSTRRAGCTHGRSRDSPRTHPTAQPPVVGLMGEVGGGKAPTQAVMRDFVCLSWGGVGGTREVQLASQMSSVGCTVSLQGQSFLVMTLTHSVFPCPAPAHSPEKRKNQA